MGRNTHRDPAQRSRGARSGGDHAGGEPGGRRSARRTARRLPVGRAGCGQHRPSPDVRGTCWLWPVRRAGRGERCRAARPGRPLPVGDLAAVAGTGRPGGVGGPSPPRGPPRAGAALSGAAAGRRGRDLPAAGGSVALRAAGLAVLRAADDAVAAAAEGFEWAHLSLARREEAERLEFFDDLLSGRGGLPDLMARGERLGLRLAGPHQVVLGGYAPGAGLARPLGLEIDRLVGDAAAPSPSLTVTRGGRVVVMTGVTDGGEAGRIAVALAGILRGGNPARAQGEQQPWRVAVGRPYPGPSGVLRSYDEASDALDVAQGLGLPNPVVDAAALLVSQVLPRAGAAITDLVGELLMPLAGARGGAGPLLATLEAYYACGGVAAQAARRLPLSVRAVTYRLARIRDLTGSDPGDPAQALALQVAVIGARLLDWPAAPLGGGPPPPGACREGLWLPP